MTPGELSFTLRKISALRDLCLRLPHLPTPVEIEHLRRFDALIVAPHTATENDIEPLVAGWQRFWRDGDPAAILAMVQALPSSLLSHDRRLETFRTAAHLAHWQRIQEAVWTCTACRDDRRVATKVRQRTGPPPLPIRLLVISLAPPFKHAHVQTLADSATNNPRDPLRLFLESTLARAWRETTDNGIALLHAVKCAITPDNDGFQNPPGDVVDTCAPRHLAREINALQPPVIATLGRQAYRAVIRAIEILPGFRRDPALRLTRPPAAAGPDAEGYEVCLREVRFRLFAGPSIRANRSKAESVIIQAARVAGVLGPEQANGGWGV